jgi:hypothetical protein
MFDNMIIPPGDKIDENDEEEVQEMGDEVQEKGDEVQDKEDEV